MRKIDVSSGGIYQIKCLSTQRVYIGSAAVFVLRISSHLTLLNSGTHPNPDLQADWTKYGRGDFEFFIVKVMSDRREYLALERELIAKQARSKLKPYNVCWKSIVKRQAADKKRKAAKAKREARMSGEIWLAQSDVARLKGIHSLASFTRHMAAPDAPKPEWHDGRPWYRKSDVIAWNRPTRPDRGRMKTMQSSNTNPAGGGGR